MRGAWNARDGVRRGMMRLAGGWRARGRRADGARTARRGCEGGNIVYKNTGNALIDAESIASHEDVARAL